MRYDKTVTLADGTACRLRHGTETDGSAVLEIFTQTHAESDYLLTYPDEMRLDVAQETLFLENKAKSLNEAELLAEIDGQIVGTAGIDALGSQYKICHRAEMGINVSKAYWGRGIGRALADACVECARNAGYTQLELQVVADNSRAITMYEHMGFTEYGRNPRGFDSRTAGYQELVLMRMEL